MKKYSKRLLAVMMVVMLCFGVSGSLTAGALRFNPPYFWGNSRHSRIASDVNANRNRVTTIRFNLSSTVQNRPSTHNSNWVHRHRDAMWDAVNDWSWVMTPGRVRNLDYRGVNLNFASGAPTTGITIHMEFFEVNDPNSSSLGWVELFNSGTRVRPWNTANNWNFGRAVLNRSSRPRPEDLHTQLAARGRSWINARTRAASAPTAAERLLYRTRYEHYYRQEVRKLWNHEIGHILGLAHSNRDVHNGDNSRPVVPYAGDVGILMTPWMNVSTAYVPTRNDVEGVIQLYR